MEQSDGHGRKQNIVRHRGPREQRRVSWKLGRASECHESEEHHHLDERDCDEDVDCLIKGHVTSSLAPGGSGIIPAHSAEQSGDDCVQRSSGSECAGE